MGISLLARNFSIPHCHTLEGTYWSVSCAIKFSYVPFTACYIFLEHIQEHTKRQSKTIFNERNNMDNLIHAISKLLIYYEQKKRIWVIVMPLPLWSKTSHTQYQD